VTLRTCKVKYCPYINHGNNDEAKRHANEHFFDSEGKVKKLDKDTEKDVYDKAIDANGKFEPLSTFYDYSAEYGENFKALLCEEHYKKAPIANKGKLAAAFYTQSGSAVIHVNKEHLGRKDG